MIHARAAAARNIRTAAGEGKPDRKSIRIIGKCNRCERYELVENMLNIIFGNCEEAIYNTAVYFGNTYKGRWITSPLSVEMIRDVDKSEVQGENLIISPVLGPISPRQLSGGVKTLMLVANDSKHIFNASTCGDNCAKWLLKIAENRKVTVNLRHMMNFGDGEFRIRVVNTGKIAHNMKELLEYGGEYI